VKTVAVLVVLAVLILLGWYFRPTIEWVTP
jgi:hypothetical protein